MSFPYLGVVVTRNDTGETEFKNHIRLKKQATKQLNGVLRNTDIRSNIKNRIYKTVIESIKTYG